VGGGDLEIDVDLYYSGRFSPAILSQSALMEVASLSLLVKPLDSVKTAGRRIQSHKQGSLALSKNSKGNQRTERTGRDIIHQTKPLAVQKQLEYAACNSESVRTSRLSFKIYQDKPFEVDGMTE
jgi:hypothetical protein